MGKHQSYSNTVDDRKTRKAPIHPIWRGIGFLFMILIPFMSWAGAVLLIQANNKNGWVPFPYDLVANKTHLLFKLIPDPMIHIKLLVMAGLMMVLFAVLSMITFAINSTFGASRYGPYDLPPVSRPKNLRRAR